MQKLTTTFNTILLTLLLSSILPIDSMDPTSDFAPTFIKVRSTDKSLCELRRTGKEYEQSALIAQEYNKNECLLFCLLPPEQVITILPYCLLRNQDRIEFSKAMQMFTQLKTVCKTFDQLLTIKEIGYCCKNYSQEYKNEKLRAALTYMPSYDYYGYNITRLPALILIYAGANANT